MEATKPETYVSRSHWDPSRPRVLVVACSDGRLQESVDEFLTHSLNITRYDRVYLPGGPGALATSGVEYVRSEAHRLEMGFLVDAHKLETIILLFHGPGPDGPVDAVCADYRRIMGDVPVKKVSDMQIADYHELREHLLNKRNDLTVMAFRCEVGGDGRIRFVELP